MNVSTGNLKIDEPAMVEKIMSAATLCTTHAEGEQLTKAIEIAAKLKKKFYACHISTEDEIKQIRKNRKYVYCEVTPHHLFLTEKDKEKLGKLADVKPSLKAEKDLEALWKALQSGIVDTIATDHAPHTKEEKLNEERAGLPGIETMLPLLLDAVNKKRLTLQQVIDLTSKNPAKIFRIKNKGQLKEGYDADLVVIDMNLEKEVKSDELLTKTGWSPFEGKVLKGWPITTIVRGNVVYDNNNIFEIRSKEIKIEKPKRLFGRKPKEIQETSGQSSEGLENSFSKTIDTVEVKETKEPIETQEKLTDKKQEIKETKEPIETEETKDNSNQEQESITNKN
jgi:dihydroorotase